MCISGVLVIRGFGGEMKPRGRSNGGNVCLTCVIITATELNITITTTIPNSVYIYTYLIQHKRSTSINACLFVHNRIQKREHKAKGGRATSSLFLGCTPQFALYAFVSPILVYAIRDPRGVDARVYRKRGEGAWKLYGCLYNSDINITWRFAEFKCVECGRRIARIHSKSEAIICIKFGDDWRFDVEISSENSYQKIFSSMFFLELLRLLYK